MKCPHQVPIRDKFDIMGNQLYRPCGMCAICRRNAVMSLQSRGMYEFKKHKYSAFLTLTYDDIHLSAFTPDCLPSLSKLDVQRFLDDLRHYVKRHNLANCDKDFSFIYCTEYGGVTARPHAHIALFGIDFPIAKQVASKLWDFGFVDSRPVHSGSVRYICKYISKGARGKYADLQFFDKGVEKPVVKWSKGFGAGLFYDNIESIRKNGCIKQGNKSIFVPSYYKNKIMAYSEPFLIKTEIEKQCSWIQKHNMAKHLGYNSVDDMYKGLALNSIQNELRKNINNRSSVDLEEL